MLFDSTLRKELARSFGATLVVILTIVITMMLIRTLGQAASGVGGPRRRGAAAGLHRARPPAHDPGAGLFVAIVVTLGRMYRDSEMAIWFSSGVGADALRRAGAAHQLAGAAGDRDLVLLVWPWGNRSSAELRERYEQRSDLSRVAPG